MTAVTGETGAMHVRRIIHPPLVELRVDEGSRGYLATGVFHLQGGPIELSALVPAAYVARVRRALARRSSATGARAPHVGAIVGGLCGAVLRRKMKAIASDPKLASKLGLGVERMRVSPRAIAAYRAARALLAPDAAAARARLARLVLAKDPRAVKAAKILAIVRKAA